MTGSPFTCSGLAYAGVNRRWFMVVSSKALSVSVEDFGDAEIEQARVTLLVHLDVGGLEVAVDNQIAMSACSTASQIFSKSCKRSRSPKPPLVRVSSDGLAVHVLHNQIRQPVLSGASVEDTRDVRMFKAGKDATLMAEAAQDGVRIHAALHDLDGYVFLEDVVAAACPVNHAHAALADDFQNQVGSNAASCGHGFGQGADGPTHGASKTNCCFLFRRQHALYFPSQFGVAVALGVKEGCALGLLGDRVLRRIDPRCGASGRHP